MNCYHCGDPCDVPITANDKNFCCTGCKTVYEILHENELDNFYNIAAQPGIKVDVNHQSYYDFLELDEVKKKYLFFENEDIKKIVFYIPQIHCNSCIWLLENSPKLYEGVQNAEVNFTDKTVQFTLGQSVNVVDFALFLQKLGYAPDFSEHKEVKSKNKDLIIKIGVAGFCFGNIMLMAFPEYLGMKDTDSFRPLFLKISFFLSLPVVFYSGWDYFRNSYIGLKNKVVNMDLPIVLGLLTLFFRSSYELYVYTGQAYFDSLAGLIFFLLIGKWYQDKTYNHLNFKRDTLSFFPIAVLKKEGMQFIPHKISTLSTGDIIKIRHKELIPCDALILSGVPAIDYSFVTGESATEYPEQGSKVFAGGKQVGEEILLQVVKNTDESYLTALWNSTAKNKKQKENRLTALSNNLSKYFTLFILLLSVATAIYWFFVDPRLIWKSVSAVLIVACPCALALSLPFTYGNAQRLLAKSNFFVRKMDLIDGVEEITDIVFDKTGTLSNSNKTALTLCGNLSSSEVNFIYTAVSNSLHPLSINIKDYLEKNDSPSIVTLHNFSDQVGLGLSFEIGKDRYKVGSKKFTQQQDKVDEGVFIAKNDEYLAHFNVQHAYRTHLEESIDELKNEYEIHVLTGDNDKDKKLLLEQYGIQNSHFNQSPSDKLHYIQKLQSEGKKVMMIGDGINDSVALSESDFGIAIANKSHSFTPASDAILEAKSFHHLSNYLKFSKWSKSIVVTSFILSFLYNAIGLFIAVQGIFAPVFAAILMPLSSISVVLFTTLSTSILAKRLF
ncbi:heavy metal translocating P-type ATPase [Brumimicrobium aurantiacum]|uniref:HAD family hydrolase n=1 Tax=Brumimicrobium aurantiacum TaxID=1737063 RepID=A0A3E1EV04_9FLAO|nr:heavy metal translocating P-type ATPase metal-binding domain-containing protein [Brumimicrobium aurantiacum]RFC53370.1 HAD family hydrolase [Brumimicrobium aurantiacum]